MAPDQPVSSGAVIKQGSWKVAGLGVRADLSVSPGLSCLRKLLHTGLLSLVPVYSLRIKPGPCPWWS